MTSHASSCRTAVYIPWAKLEATHVLHLNLCISFVHDIEAQIMFEVGSFQEVTTKDESTKDIMAFTFSIFSSDLINSSFDLHTGNSSGSDIIKLQWETVSGNFRGFITVMAERDDLHQGQNTSEGAMRYRFTVNATDLAIGEGPLLLTLYIKLKCIQSCATNCYRLRHVPFGIKQYYQQRCTCTQWQYQGESETILVSGEQGEPIGNVHSIQHMHTQKYPLTIFMTCMTLYYNSYVHQWPLVWFKSCMY